jgi:hypothetical protein
MRPIDDAVPARSSIISPRPAEIRVEIETRARDSAQAAHRRFQFNKTGTRPRFAIVGHVK